jgi:hypothetical protein
LAKGSKLDNLEPLGKTYSTRKLVALSALLKFENIAEQYSQKIY